MYYSIIFIYIYDFAYFYNEIIIIRDKSRMCNEISDCLLQVSAYSRLTHNHVSPFIISLPLYFFV